MGQNSEFTTRASRSRISLLKLIVIIGICSTWNAAGVQGAFNRPCDEHGSCSFSVGVDPHKSFIELICSKEKSCECKMVQLADASFWKLSWNAKSKTCLIPIGGPCGVDRGLEIGCISGLECIENRCRDRKKLGQSPKGFSCDSDIDCVKGLKCKFPENPGPWELTRCLEH